MLPLKILQEIEQYIEENKLNEKQKNEIIKITRNYYSNILYDSQEPIGVIAAQSLSEPTTQMSLDYSENVIIKHKGVIKITPIGQFIDLTINKLGNEEREGWEVLDVSDKDLLVPSITRNEKIKWRQVKEISRHQSPESLLEIKTLSGRKIIATDSHSFFTRKNNSIVPILGKDLNPGERLPSISFLPENCTQSIQTETLIGKAKYIKKPLPETLKLNKELGWLFGAYLSEGNTTDFYVSFSNTDPSFLSKIRDFAKLHGFTFNEYDNDRGFSLGHDIRINSKQLSRLMKVTCGTGSTFKKVPDFAYSAHIDFVTSLLSGYFDGDGSISVNRNMIRVHSNSEDLIDGIKLLLTRVKIFAHKSRDKKQWYLLIPYKYAPTFRKHINFTIPSKAGKLQELCAHFEDNNIYKDHIDMIGGFDDILITISKKLGLPSRYVNSSTKRQKIGRETLLRHIEHFEKMSQEKSIDITKDIIMLKKMYNSDVVWDEIISISKVKPSNKYVYDFTVPGTESFTTFDGIVTHNTMRTYHFAGTAGIQVTLGLPRLLEIFDARKKPKTPTMTIYLLPEYQTEEKAKQIAEQVKETKVKDVTISNTINLTDLEIECKLNMRLLKSLGLEPEKLDKKIKLRNIDVEVSGDILKAKYKKPDIRDIFKLKYKLLESYLRGIKGVSQTVINKGEDQWVINTLGSDLKKVQKIEGIDTKRTTSNNIFEVLDVLGVEAARNAIIKQAMYTIEEQGLGIDIRYLMLLADLMTMDGIIRPIGRYGIVGHKKSVLARAGFEETKKHIVRAAIMGEKDLLQGVVENVMVNQVVPIGTGSYRLLGKLLKGKEESKERDIADIGAVALAAAGEELLFDKTVKKLEEEKLKKEAEEEKVIAEKKALKKTSKKGKTVKKKETKKPAKKVAAVKSTKKPADKKKK